MNYDNPAARLLSLLSQGKEIPEQTPCFKAWEELLGVQDNNSLLMTRLGKVMELPRSTIEAVQETFPDQPNTWSHWEAQVNSAFMVQNMHANWATFINHIDSHTITYLRMAAALLEAKANTKLIANEDLMTIREKLSDILAEVLTSNQPDEVKSYLARSLSKVIATIDEYKITGALPLLDLTEKAIAHAAFDDNYKAFLSNTELGQRLLETLASMANVVTVAIGIPQITQTIALLTN